MPSDQPSRAPLLIALVIGLCTAAVYCLYGWFQWHQLESPSWDLGIFSQLAKAYSTFSAPIVSIKGDGFNLLGDHFHPILVLTGPLWRLWPSPVMLLFLQAVLFGLSAVPLTRLAIERWGAALGTVLGLSYGFSWGLQGAVVSQFHEIAFGVPIAAFALVSYLRGRFLPAALWMGALVFVKEDLGLTVSLFGFILALRHWSDHRTRWIGTGLAVWGAAWLALATAVILPLLNPQGQYDYTDRLGSLMSVFVPVDKWVTVALLAAAAGLIGLASPLMLLMLPTLAWRFVGTVPYYWSWQWHYSAMLIPIAFAALLETTQRWPKLRIPALLVSVASTAVLGAAIPMLKLLDPDFREPSPRWAAAQRVLESIPDGADVASDRALVGYLVPDHEVFWIRGEQRPPEFVVIDERGGFENWGSGRTPQQYVEDVYGIGFEPHFSEDGYAVMRRS